MRRLLLFKRVEKWVFLMILFSFSVVSAFAQELKKLEDASESLKDSVIVIIGNVILAALAIGSLWVIWSLIQNDGKASRGVVVGFILGWAFYLIVFMGMLG